MLVRFFQSGRNLRDIWSALFSLQRARVAWRRHARVIAGVVMLVALGASGLYVAFRAHANTAGVTSTPGYPWAWGQNGDGELGASTSGTCGTIACGSTPVQVNNVTGVQALAGGDQHSLALTATGVVYAWGLNNAGQLGNASVATGAGSYSATPVQVNGLPSGVTAISAGASHSLALTSAGVVYAWGSNDDGELGNASVATGTGSYSATPVQVSGLSSAVTAIAAGGHESVALTSAGAVYAWGDNTYGQLGSGASGSSSVPVQVMGLPSTVVAVATSGNHNVALTSSGTVYAWGDNSDGQLGNGTTTSSSTPVQVSGLSGVKVIAAGGNHTVALTSDGTVYAWGENVLGDLGATTTQTCANGDACSMTPLQVSGLPSTTTAIAAGNGHSLALTSSGTVYAWGENDLGQLGNGSSDSNAHPAPAQVSTLTGVTVIATGSNHSLAAVNAVASLSTTYINFGDQQVGTSSPAQPITITNAGIVPLTITGATLGGANAGDFTLATGSCPSSPTNTTIIPAGGNCTITVSFAPHGVGTRNGTLTVTSDAFNNPLNGSVTGTGVGPVAGLSPSNLTFGSQYVGTSSGAQTVTVTNSGNADLTISAIGLSGANASDFSYTASALPITVAPGSSTTVSVTFTPASGAAGTRTATLSFTDNDSYDPNSVALSGTALLPADLGISLTGSPNPVKTRTNLTYTITVTNGGSGAASGVVVSDTLPTGTVFSSVSTTQGSCTAPAVGGTGTVNCTVSSLGNGSSVTVTLVVTVNTTAGTTLNDTASVSASTYDLNTANNSATVATGVKH